MHTVAREWKTDVAAFFLHYGANIDQEDNYGRTPLFVAVAMNYVDMIDWLLDHGGK